MGNSLAPALAPRCQPYTGAETLLAIAEHTGVAAQRGGYVGLKRAFDLALSALLLGLLSPVLVVVAALIKLDSRGPVFFRQERLGQSMRRFLVWKFRTMRPDADPELHRRYIEQLVSGEVGGDRLKKLVDDPRVTRVGRLLRSTSIDEIPQIFNVLRGEMSLVGPRPALDYELEHYLPRHFRRFEVRPGITGLWQVSGRNELDFVQMLDLDVRYVTDMGPRTDLKILVKTPMAMVGKAA